MIYTAKKKISEGPITSIGRNPDALEVHKSKPLMALWRSDLTLAEFKILDTYLARINPHDDTRREVIFEKGEIEGLLGVQRIRTDDLDRRLEHLMTTIRIDDDSKHKIAFHRIALFERAYVEQGADGLVRATLACTPAAMQYIFNCDEIGYLRYKLRCITGLSSRYAYVLFCYLETNRFRKRWRVSVDELKEILHCEKEPSYSGFKEFNKSVLRRAQAEILTKTECKFTYTPERVGRKVVAVHFELQTLPDLAPHQGQDQDQTSLFDVDVDVDRDEDDELSPLWHDATQGRFTASELAELDAWLRTVEPSVMPMSPDKFGWEVAKFHYMEAKMAALGRREATTKVAHPYAYLLQMIKQDCGC